MTKIYEQKFNKWKDKYRGLSEDTLFKLEKLIKKFEKTNSVNDYTETKIKAKQIADGTKLIREYNGKKHEVIALKEGFQYKNKTYKSLSAIANEITGTRWNGKRFFGVCK